MRLFVDTQYVSPYAMTAFVALVEKNLPFEVEALDLAAGRHREAGFARASLTQRVPTLVDGDFTLSESSAIAEYLDDVYPGQALYPRDARSRARARQVQAWLRSDLMPLRQERSTEVVFYGKKGVPLTGEGQRAAAKLVDAAQALLAHGGDHLFGDWSIADVDLALMLNRLALHGDPLPAPLARYAAAQWSRPSVQRWVTHARPAI
jgi:glutathione S-transferase